MDRLASLPLPSYSATPRLYFRSTPQTGAPDPAEAPAPVAKPKSTWRVWMESAVDIFRKGMGFIDGIYESAQILKNVRAWNDTFLKVAPESNYYDRTMGILDLTYTVFRESIHSTLNRSEKGGETTTPTSPFKPNDVSFSLYKSLLSRFPGLLKEHKGLPGDFDIVKRAIRYSTNPAWGPDQKAEALQKLENEFYGELTPDQCKSTLCQLLGIESLG